MCLVMFEPKKPLQFVCSPKCAHQYSLNHLKKQSTKDKKEGLEKLKTKGQLFNELQAIFNKFIRLRDKDLPCISCGTVKESIKYDAGHYQSVGGHANLRFNEYNVNKQCSKNCNVSKGGNKIEYRKGLLKKYGEEVVNSLESNLSTPLNLSKVEIEELKVHYRLKIKELELKDK